MTQTQCLVVAGAQKSCSTSLAALLSRHPGIRMMPREVFAFEDPTYPSGLRRVRSHLRTSLQANVLPALKRPEIMHRPEVAYRLRRHLPRPFCVVVLREPIARTLSAYYHYVNYGILPPIDHGTGITQILHEIQTSSGAEIRHEVVNYSLYKESLHRLRDTFEDRLLIFYQEEILDDTAICVAQVLDALELPRRVLGSLPHANAGNYALRRVCPSRIAGRFAYHLDKQNASFRPTSNPLRQIAARAFSGIGRLSVSKPTPPVLSSTVRSGLAEFFSADARSVPGLVGRPLPDPWERSLSESCKNPLLPFAESRLDAGK